MITAISIGMGPVWKHHYEGVNNILQNISCVQRCRLGADKAKHE